MQKTDTQRHMLKLDLVSLTTSSKEIFYRLRWGEMIYCPSCGSIHIYNPDPGQSHICADCDHRFSDTSGTAFHSTKLPLVKWLVAIYMFCTQSKGISSYNLARMISVSQPTAWRMLMVLRLNIKHDLQVTDTALVDEVYLGADWKKKPYKDKIKKCPPPNPIWNLKGEDLKKYYKSQMMKAASEDKIPILGISCYNSRSLILHPYMTPPTIDLIKSQLTEHYDDVSHWISDQSKLYWWMDDLDHIKHSVCDHQRHLYISKDGYSSNRLEGAFAHLKRMWRGVYHWFSKKFAPAYLNEFSWRWSNFDLSTESRILSLMGCLV